mgnify:CR=1 FL=1
MRTRTSTLALFVALSDTAAIALTSSRAQADNWCPIRLDQCSPAEGLFLSTFSPVLFTATSLAVAGVHDKEVLANAVIEDVAVFYDSGRLAGVLPVVLDHVKAILAQERGTSAEQITDREAVDRVGDAAAAALE